MISKLWPARTMKHPDDPVTDLDAIIAKPVHFQLKGKMHRLEPIVLEDFLKFTNAQASLMRAMSDKETKLSVRELAEKITAVFASVCSTLTVDDVLGMEQAQVAALFQLVMDHVTGQVDFGDGKKKRAKIPIYDIARASSLPNASSTGGPQSKP